MAIKIPFYAKVALIFIGLFALVFIMHIGREIIIPLMYSAIIAILLNPLVVFFVHKGINKLVAITLVVTLGICVFAGFIYIIYSQLTLFSETYPALKEKFNALNNEFMEWLAYKLNMEKYEVIVWLDHNQAGVMDSIAYGQIISEALRILFVGILIPVYVVMILYYKPLLLEFIRKLFKSQHHNTVTEVLNSSKVIIQSYLVGLFVEFIIVATMNSLGLLLIGIDYAIILGILGAVFNIIPYLGGIIAIAMPMIIAIVTKDSTIYPVLVLLVYIFIQFIDNNFVIPLFVASRVQINALVSVVVVLVGGALWGIPGMFLSIPLTAIIKVVFDHIDPLKPWGFLLGNMVPATTKYTFIKPKKSRSLINFF